MNKPEFSNNGDADSLAVGVTALELLSQSADAAELRRPGQPGPPGPPAPPTPPQRFPTSPKPTPPDIYGYPDVSPPDEEWLHE